CAVPTDHGPRGSLSFDYRSPIHSPFIKNSRFSAFLNRVHLLAEADVVFAKDRGKGFGHHTAVIKQGTVFTDSISIAQIPKTNTSQILVSAGTHPFKSLSSISGFQNQAFFPDNKADGFI